MGVKSGFGALRKFFYLILGLELQNRIMKSFFFTIFLLLATFTKALPKTSILPEIGSID